MPRLPVGSDELAPGCHVDAHGTVASGGFGVIVNVVYSKEEITKNLGNPSAVAFSPREGVFVVDLAALATP